ncbi:proline/serine-rich coiled-coil protein 1 isoform X3 [Rhineura floridana]|nr:proline/serine-rich coiled-coil protein 1 isoform X3 [Rhineura floridana]XP_061488510.1 proline/serine-rich coiled-coil protein 1 isoform X3 [Rhineura floridana]
MELPNEDIKFITDETLDFGLPFPFDGQDEEVSVTCPTEPNERCAAQTSYLNILLGETEGRTREQAFQWSSLSPEKLEEVMKEANKLAEQLERCRLLEKENASSEMRLKTVPEYEPLPPIGFLNADREGSSNPRRRTFNVNNSPLKALLPTVGPESCSALGSPKAPFTEKGRPSCVADLPVPKKLQNKSNTCCADNRLSKKSRPDQSLKALTPTKSPGTKKTNSRSSRTDRPSPPTLPRIMQKQQPLLGLRSSLQTNRRGPLRKAERASVKDHSAKDSQPLQDSASKGTMPVANTKGRLDPRLDPLKRSPMKKSSAAPEKVVTVQKANANQAKCMGRNGPQLQASCKPHSSFCETRTRSTATSVLASHLPGPNSIPKATSRIAILGRHAVTERPSQLKSLGLGVSGGKGFAMPGPAGQKASAFQQTVPSDTSQHSRLQLPKKVTSGNSR